MEQAASQHLQADGGEPVCRRLTGGGTLPPWRRLKMCRRCQTA